MPSTFIQHELPNGLRVVCEAMPRVRSAAAGFLAQTGARHESPTEHGVSHFLEHMCFKGTPRRTWHDINIRFDELGAIYNAFTGKEHTVYYGWVPGRRIEEQIELLADMMRPSLPPQDFETERNVILEEIAMSDDNFDRLVWNFVHEVIFGDHPLGHEILGEKETIQQLPHATLADYHRRRYAANNLCLMTAGAIEPEAVFAAAGRHCGDWMPSFNGVATRAEMPPWPTGVRKLALPRFQQQSIVLAYPSIPRGHPMEESVEVFTSLFGGQNSRCFWNIVQKGICADAGAIWVGYRDCGAMIFYADGQPDRCDAMLSALQDEIRRVKSEGIRPEEVQRVKNQRRTHLALEAESPRTRLMQLIDDYETRGHLRTPEAALAAVEAVTVKSVEAVVDAISLDDEGLLLSCGPHDWP